MTAGLPGALKRPARVYRSTLAAILIISIAAAPARAQDATAATPARAQDATAATPEAPTAPHVDQVIYKGVVGNLLEAVPLDPEQRLRLQRGNAIVSNTLTGRSLALLLGLASPAMLMVGGLIWGLWAASNIKEARPAAVALAPHASDVAEIARAPAVESASGAASPEEPPGESAESANP